MRMLEISQTFLEWSAEELEESAKGGQSPEAINLLKRIIILKKYFVLFVSLYNFFQSSFIICWFYRIN